MTFKCNICNNEFSTKQNLTKHLNRKISCNNVIKCDNCHTIFDTTYNLRRHLNRKTPCKKINIPEENEILKIRTEVQLLKQDFINISEKTENEILELKLKNQQLKKTKNDEILKLKLENQQLKKTKNDEILKLKLENQQLKKTNNNEILKLKLENQQLKKTKNDEILKLKLENQQLKKTKNSSNGHIYILTNLNYQLQGIYKVSRTINLKSRLSTYNTPKIEKDKYSYIYSFKTYDNENLENYIHDHPKLKEFKIKNEIYKIKFEDLKEILIEIKNEFDEL